MGIFALFRPVIEWWAGLTPWLRIGIPLALIGASTILFFLEIVFFWGWLLGIVLLLFSERSESEKKGYHF